MIVVYTCTVHKKAKLAQDEQWSATKYEAANKLRNRVEIIESVCPDCIEVCKKSLHALMEKRYAAQVPAA